MQTLTKIFRFSASHTLNNPDWSEKKNQEVFGKCANLHGHNYVLEVSVVGSIQADSGMIMNATDLSALVNEHIINSLDHKDLNTGVPWFKEVVTTAENLNEAIWERLSAVMIDNPSGVELSQLKLWETDKMFVTKTRER